MGQVYYEQVIDDNAKQGALKLKPYRRSTQRLLYTDCDIDLARPLKVYEKEETQFSLSLQVIGDNGKSTEYRGSITYPDGSRLWVFANIQLSGYGGARIYYVPKGGIVGTSRVSLSDQMVTSSIEEIPDDEGDNGTNEIPPGGGVIIVPPVVRGGKLR